MRIQIAPTPLRLVDPSAALLASSEFAGTPAKHKGEVVVGIQDTTALARPAFELPLDGMSA